MAEPATIIADNVARVRERIAAAAERSGRPADEVTLVAVTKYVGLAETRALIAAGCRDLGESRPQQLWQKAESLGDEPVRWHMVGHLQRNKVRRTLPLVALLHSGDSERLVAAVADELVGPDKSLPVLLEVNVSGDAKKHGFASLELEEAFERMARLPGVELRGLMAMAGWGSTAEVARKEFASLREFRDRLRSVAPRGVCLDELSMGMSRDFEAAIAEGATMVRIGSLLYEGLPG